MERTVLQASGASNRSRDATKPRAAARLRSGSLRPEGVAIA
jgi:hypothetical protein